MHKVLLIEDDDVLLRMYKKVLSYNGYIVETAENAEEGFIKAKSFMPNLIFLDVMMSKMNGLQLLKILKKNKQTQDIAVILLTNLGIQEELDNAIKNGALRYIIKNDLDPNEIVSVVKEVLREN